MMNKSCKEYLENFSKLANKKGLHPVDWKRFYDFIYRAYRAYGSGRPETDEIEKYLIEEGFSKSYAHELILHYETCLDMLLYLKGKKRL